MRQYKSVLLLALLYAFQTFAQQQCYFGPGAVNRGPANLVPCLGSGASACCLLGDVCLSGNTCWNYETGDLYQYGCTDVTYKDSTCPFKCGFNATLSPWTALEYCSDLGGVSNTWVCHGPESCGCDWGPPNYGLNVLQPRGCKEMGNEARAALYAPAALAPYVSLPSTYGGSTGYFSPITVSGTSSWVSTVIAGYTPATIQPLTNYGPQPSTVVLLQAGVAPAPSTAVAPSSTPTSTSASGTSTSSQSAVAVPSSFGFTTTVTSAPSSTSEAASSSTIATTGSGDTSTLSTGAKAGIGVGVAGFALALIAIIAAFLIWRKSQRKNQKAGAGGDVSESDPNFRTDKTPAWSGVYRPDSEARYEINSTGDQGSMYSDRRTTAGSTVVNAWNSMQPPNSPPTELAAADVPRELHAGPPISRAELES